MEVKLREAATRGAILSTSQCGTSLAAGRVKVARRHSRRPYGTSAVSTVDIPPRHLLPARLELDEPLQGVTGEAQPPASPPAATSPAATMRAIKGCTSLWQLERHLQVLPARCLNHMHLAAALTHAAQLHTRAGAEASSLLPHRAWLAALAASATSPPTAGLLQPRQVSNMLWAMARLGLVVHGPQQGQRVTSGEQEINAALQRSWDVLSAKMDAWLVDDSTQGYHRPQSLSPLQCIISLQAWALAGQGPPTAGGLRAALGLLQPRLGDLSAHDTATLAHALANLGCEPSEAWVSAFLRASRLVLPAMDPQQLANTVWALPHLLPDTAAPRCGPARGLGAAAAAELQQWREQLMGLMEVSGQAVDGMGQQAALALLWGLGQLGWHPGPATMSRLLDAAVGQLGSPAAGSGRAPGRKVLQVRAAANVVTAAARLGAPLPPDVLSAAMSTAVSRVRGGGEGDPRAWLQDVAALVSGAANMRVRPSPRLMACAVAAASDAASALAPGAALPHVAQLLWGLAQLGFAPEANHLHRMVAACIPRPRGASNPSEPGAHQPSAGLPKTPGALSPSSSELSHIAQLLWALAALQQASHAAAGAQGSLDESRGQGKDPVTASEVVCTQPPPIIPPPLMGHLALFTAAALARTPRPDAQLAALTWALARLSARQPHRRLPAPLRVALLAGVGRCAARLPLRHLAACVAALPRCGCTRRLDANGMLAAVTARAVPQLGDGSSWEVRVLLSGLADMGYVLGLRQLRAAVAGLLANQRLLHPSAAKDLLASVTALTTLGLAAAPQEAERLREPTLGALLRRRALAGLQPERVVHLIDVTTDLRWHLDQEQWRVLLRHVQHRLLPRASGSQVAGLLFALAQHEAGVAPAGLPDAGSGALTSAGLPPRPWMHAVVSHCMRDMAAWSPGDVARLLVALVRLRYPPSRWLRALNMQLDLRSALLSKADHALVRGAWSQLARTKHANSTDTATTSSQLPQDDTQTRSAAE